MTTPPLTLTLDLDHAAMPTGDAGRLTLVARVRAAIRDEASKRPPLAVVFALDVSGSMEGDPLAQVVDSVERLVDLLEPTDQIGVVVFSELAEELVPVAALSDAHRALVRARTSALAADRTTNIEAGLRQAQASLRPLRQGARALVLLLSDGAPNQGLTTAEALADVAAELRSEASVSTLGYGANHAEDLLEAIGHAGGGTYRYISDPLVCRADLAHALSSQADVVATGLELELRPSDGVEIVRVMGRQRTRFGRSGLIVSLADAMSDDRQLAVVQLQVQAPRDGAVFEVVRATLRGQASGGHTPIVVEQVADIRLSTSGWGAPTPGVRADVLLVQGDEARVEARHLVERGQHAAAAARLREVVREIDALDEAERLPGLLELREQLVDEADVAEKEPDLEAYRVAKRHSMSYSPSHQSRSILGTSSLSAWGKSMIDDASGTIPDAHLEMLEGPQPGRRFPLGAKQIIGRTADADICVQDATLSRSHAQIIVRDGRFLVVDLGSSNGSSVNDVRLGHGSPRPLGVSDTLRLGNVRFAFRLGPADPSGPTE